MNKKTWLTIGAVSLGLGAIPPLRANAAAGTDGSLASKRATVLHIARDGRPIDERKLSDEPRLLSERGDRDRLSAVPDWVENDRDWRYIRVANLPDAVRRTVDRHKGDDIITEAVKVTRGDRTVYRLMFKDQRSGAHRVIRVDRDGTLLGVDRARDEDRVKVNWQSLSPPVKDTIWRESHGQNIENVYRVIRGNRVWYIAEINARGHDRFIRVDNDGRLSGSWAEDPRDDR